MDNKEFALQEHEKWAGKIEVISRAKTGYSGRSGCLLYTGCCGTLHQNIRGCGSFL